MAERGDAELWRRATRGVEPLRARPAAPPPAPRPPPPAPRRAAALFAPVPAPPPLDHFAGLDRASAERLRRGRFDIAARLDLHGMTQEQAHRALLHFIPAARAAGHRCVLVITGRGSAGGGVLRQAVPRWLEEPGLRPHLLAVAPARPRDGGSGALYLLLRRAGR